MCGHRDAHVACLANLVERRSSRSSSFPGNQISRPCVRTWLGEIGFVFQKSKQLEIEPLLLVSRLHHAEILSKYFGCAIPQTSWTSTLNSTFCLSDSLRNTTDNHLKVETDEPHSPTPAFPKWYYFWHHCGKDNNNAICVLFAAAASTHNTGQHVSVFINLVYNESRQK